MTSYSFGNKLSRMETSEINHFVMQNNINLFNWHVPAQHKNYLDLEKKSQIPHPPVSWGFNPTTSEYFICFWHRPP